MKNLNLVEKLISGFLLISIIYALFIYFTDAVHFDDLVKEDGFYENLTAVFLLLTSITLFYKFFKFQKYYGLWWKVGVLLMAVSMFFGSGEEISWGQRIFNIHSSEFFSENNAQQETNLHNLVVDGVKLNKIIFSNLMSICFGIYFLVLPILWKKSPKIKSLLDTFGISVARSFQIVIFLFATALILIPIVHNRKWEIWEFAFALIMFLIVYNPINTKEIFSKKQLD